MNAKTSPDHKTLHVLRAIAIFCLLAAGSLFDHARAATYTWDASGNVTGGNATDGSGTWSTTGTNWDNGGGDSPWTTGNNAVIGNNNGAAGTITVASVTVGNLTFNAPGSGAYTLTGGTITFGSGSVITVNAASGTISSAISDGSALTKSGAGTLVLNGSNSSIGGLTVNGGTLNISGGTGNNIPGLTTATGTATVFEITGGTTNSQAFIAENGASILVTSGTWTPQCTSNPIIGDSATTGTSNYTQTGGSVTLGNAANVVYTSNLAGDQSSLTFSGGSFTASGIDIGQRDNSTATISGSGLVTLNGQGFQFGFNGNIGSPTSRILNLGDGTNFSAGTSGILATTKVAFPSAAGNATFNFNGGTLRALNSSTTFMQSLTTANVLASGGIIDTNGFNITIAQNLSHGGAAAIDGGLTKVGAGTLTLSGSNSYTGSTAINSGTLDLSSQYAAQDSTVTMSGTGALVFDSAVSGNAFTVGGLSASTSGAGYNIALQNNAGTPAAIALSVGAGGASSTYAGILSGSGSLIKTGTGTLVLTASNAYTGATTVSQGTLQIGSGGTTGALSGSSAITDNGVLAFNRSNAVTQGTDFSGAAITGTGGITQAGSATLTLNAANTYSGSTILASGTVDLSNQNAAENSTVVMTGSGALVFDQSVGANAFTLGGLSAASSGADYDIALQNNAGTPATIALTVGSGGASSTYAGVLSGGGSLTKTGTGTLILTASSAYTGATTVGQGILQIGNGGTTGALSTSSTITDNGVLAFNRSNAVTQGTDFSGAAITGTGGIRQSGSGTLTLNAANTYSGPTILASGTLDLSNQNAVQNSTVTMTGTGALVFDQSVGANAFTLGGLSAASSGAGYNIALQNNAGSPAAIALTVGGNNASNTYAGVLSGPGSLVETGTGTLTLTASNTYTGATTISSGTLQIGAGGTTGSLASTLITDNGSLVYNRSDTINLTSTYTGTGSLTLNAGAGTIGIRGPINLASVTATSSFASSVQSLYGTAYASAINLFANVTTTGNQAYNGIVSIGSSISATGATVLTTTGGGSVSLPNGALGGFSGYFSANQLWINTSAGNGNVTLGGQSALEYGIGNLSISSGTGTITLTGGSYYYDYSVLNGNVALTGSTSFAADGQRWERGVTFDGNVSGTSTLTVSLGGGAAGSTGTGANGLIFNNGGSSQLVSVNIAGSSGPTVIGTGTTVLSGSNSYTGAVAINGGVLNLGSTNAIPSSDTITFGGGTLQYSGSNAGDYSGKIASSGSAISIDTNGQNVTFASPLAATNNGGLTKLGSGTLSLTNTNTYTGATTVSGGTLQITGTGNLGGGNYSGNIADNATLTFNTSSAQTLGGIISGSGALNQSGAGTLTLGNVNPFTGTVTIAGGATLAVTSTAGFSGSSTIVDNGAFMLNNTAGQNLVPSGLSGTGALTGNVGNGTIGITSALNLGSVSLTSSNASTAQTVYGSGYGAGINLFANVTTSGNQTYNGIVSIGRGAGANPTTTLTTTGSGNVTLANGVVSGVSGYWSAGTLTIDTSAGNGNVTLGGQALAYGVGNLSINSGTGAITLTGGYYMYDYSVFNGNVALTGSTAFESGPIANLGTAQWVDGVTFNGNVTGPGVTLNATLGGGLASTSGTGTAGLFFNTASTQLVSANIIGTAGPTITGGGVTTFTGTDTYTGATKINAGTLQIGNGGTAGSILSSSGISGSSGAALVFDTSSSGTYANAISGGLSVTQAGTGTIKLNSVSYSGSTNVTNTGTLIVAGAISGNANVSGGGMLSVTGNILGNAAINNGVLNAGNTVYGTAVVTGGTLAGLGPFESNVTIGNGLGGAGSSVIEATLNGGTGSDTVILGGNLALNSDSAFKFTLNSDNQTTDELVISGTLTLTGALLTGLDAGSTALAPGSTTFVIADATHGINGTFSNSVINIGQNWYTVSYPTDGMGGDEVLLTAAIPEPTTWGTVFIGFAMLLGLQRRRSARLK